MLYGCCVFVQSKSCGKNDKENFERVEATEIFIYKEVVETFS
jgi:hypothetical protein